MPRSSTRARVWPLFAALIGLGSLPTASGQESEANVREAILKRLRLSCTEARDAKSTLRGVYIKDGSDNNGALVLDGLIDGPEQAKLLQKEGEKLLARYETWRGRYPKGVSTNRMKIVRLRSQCLPGLKADFASSLGSLNDEKQKLLFLQTRIDDVFYSSQPDKMELVFVGQCIYKGARATEDIQQWAKESLEKTIRNLVKKDYGIPALVNTSQIQFLENPVPIFQARFTERLLRDDILFQNAHFAADGTLLLEGLVGKQTAPVLPTLFDQDPHYPRISLKGMKTITWPVQLHKWNDRLADHADRHFRETLIDRVYFSYSDEEATEIHCEAFRFFETGSKFDQKGYVRKLQSHLETELARLAREWPIYKDLIPEITEVRRGADLLGKLQRDAIQVLGLKETVIEKTSFNVDGKLVVEGLVGNQEQRQLFEKHLKETVTRRRLSEESVEKLRTEQWQLKLKSIQRALATNAEGFLPKTRLDRITFGWNTKDDIPQIELAGICLQEDFGQNAAERKKLEAKLLGERKDLEKKLLRLCQTVWPAFRDQFSDAISIDGIQSVILPLTDSQQQIADQPSLDGASIKGFQFDGDGKLVIKGLWKAPSQERELRALLESNFKKAIARPDINGIVFSMETVPTDVLLQDLRKFSADKLEDVRLDRVYFDSGGKLRVEGIIREENAKEDEERLLKELKRLIKYVPNGKLLHESIPEKGLRKQEDKKPASKTAMALLTEQHIRRLGALDMSPWLALLQLVGEKGDLGLRPSVAKHLREKILLPSDPRWDGVLLERGYFDEGETYHLAGLVDTAVQKKLLTDVLEEMADLPEWRGVLGKKWNLDRLKELPLQPMKEAVNRALPDYEEGDGLRVERYYHVYMDKMEEKKKDEKKDEKETTRGWKLEVKGYVVQDGKEVTEKKKEAVHEVLGRLVREHPEWKRRLGDGLQLNLKPVPRNESIAQLAQNKTLRLLIEHLPDSLNLSTRTTVGWTFYGCTPVLLVQTADSTPKRVIPKFPPANVLAESIQYLDRALLHIPGDSTPWFLRAACHLAKGDRLAAARDLRRMNKIESREPEARAQRMVKLEHLQGELRMFTTYFGDQVTIDVAGGRAFLTLAESAVLP